MEKNKAKQATLNEVPATRVQPRKSNLLHEDTPQIDKSSKPRETNHSEIYRIYNPSEERKESDLRRGLMVQRKPNSKSIYKFISKDNVSIYTKKNKLKKKPEPSIKTEIEMDKSLNKSTSKEDPFESSFVKVEHLDSISEGANPQDLNTSYWDPIELEQTPKKPNRIDRDDFLETDKRMFQLTVNRRLSGADSDSNEPDLLDGFSTLGVYSSDDFDPTTFLSANEFELILQSKQRALLFRQNLASIVPQVFLAGLPGESRKRVWQFLAGAEKKSAQLGADVRDYIKTGLFLFDRILYDEEFQEFFQKKKKFLVEIGDFYFYFDEYYFDKTKKRNRQRIEEILQAHGVCSDSQWQVAFYKNIWQIEKDLMRTNVPQRIKATRLANVFLNSIRRVLLCHIIRNPRLGYVQGMNVIIAGMLYALSCHRFNDFLCVDIISGKIVDSFKKMLKRIEGVVFHLFQVILDRFGLRDCFTREMTKIYELNGRLDQSLIEANEPLYKHLYVSGLGTLCYFSSSYFTCLTHITDMSFVPRLLDLLFCFGIEFQNKILLEILLHSAVDVLARPKDDCMVHFVR